MAEQWFPFLVLCLVTSSSAQYMTYVGCDNLLLKPMTLTELCLTNAKSTALLPISDECMANLLQRNQLVKLEIDFCILDEQQLCRILHDKPSLKELEIFDNELKTFNVNCFNLATNLTVLQIHYNPNIKIVGNSTVIKNIETFQANGNEFTKFPLGVGWSNLKKIELDDWNNFDWSTTFHVDDFPMLQIINDLPKDEFLNSIYYHKKRDNKQTNNASTIIIIFALLFVFLIIGLFLTYFLYTKRQTNCINHIVCIEKQDDAQILHLDQK